MNTITYPPVKVGDVFVTSQSGECIVLAVTGTGTSNHTCTIQFKSTGYIRDIRISELRRGHARDVYTPTALGVGFLGDGPYKGNEVCYNAWRSMLERCYGSRAIDTYKNVTVDVVWHNYQNFAAWFEHNYRDGYHLDKDLLVPNNNVYGPLTCLYVPRTVNHTEAVLRSMVNQFPEFVNLYTTFTKQVLEVFGNNK